MTFRIAFIAAYMIHVCFTANRAQAKGTYALHSINHKAKQTSPKPTSEHLYC